MISGCATRPETAAQPAPAPLPVPPPAPPPVPVGIARIKGSEETSALLDNFTAFVAAIDGQPVAAGRNGWETPLAIKAGRHLLTVEFNRGVFVARAGLELEAAADASYEVKYATDAQVFGHNSYCDFWIVDTRTGKIVTAVRKAQVSRNR